MKIDRSKCKKILTEIPLSCKGLIQKLKTCDDKDLVNILKEINIWEYGKVLRERSRCVKIKNLKKQNLLYGYFKNNPQKR